MGLQEGVSHLEQRRDLALRREVQADHVDLERHSVNGHCSPEDAPAGKGRGPGPSPGEQQHEGRACGTARVGGDLGAGSRGL